MQKYLASVINPVLDSTHFYAWCFCVSLAIRAALIFLVPYELSSDAGWYYNRAVSIATGHGYSEGGYPTAYWPVGYPGFLGALFFSVGKYKLTGQLANLVIASFTFYLVILVTRRIFRCDRTARLAVALLAVYPNNVAYTAILLSEVYLTFLILLGIYLYISYPPLRWTIISGLIFGLAALTKPQIVLLPGFLILLALSTSKTRELRRQALGRGLVIYIMMAVILAPWAVRNYFAFGEVVLASTNGGLNLLIGNNPAASGGYDSDPLSGLVNFSVKQQVSVDRYSRELAMRYIKEHPGQFFKIIPSKLWRMWAKDGEADYQYQAGYEQYGKYSYIFKVIRWINQIYYVSLLFLFFISVYVYPRHRKRTDETWVVIGYLLVIYFTIISLVFFGAPRFHFPVMPWIIMYVAWVIILYTNDAKNIDS